MSSLSKFLSDSQFRFVLKKKKKKHLYQHYSHAALAGTPVLNILVRDLKAFCGDSSGDFFDAEMFVVFVLQSSHVNTQVVSVDASISNMYMIIYGRGWAGAFRGTSRVVHDVLVPYDHCLPWHKDPPTL